MCPKLLNVLSNIVTLLSRNLSLSEAYFCDRKTFFLVVMQAGFAFLEAGAARLKNTTDIILKKMIILCKQVF